MDSLMACFKIVDGPIKNSSMDCLNITIDWVQGENASSKTSNYYKVSDTLYANVVIWNFNKEGRPLEKTFKVRMLLYWLGRDNVMYFSTWVSNKVKESIRRSFKGVLCK